MTDLETRLRDAMQTAVPERFDASGLSEGAQRYAVRTRRLRLASTALVAAVAVGIVGTSTSGLFRDRATEPAVPAPAPITLCPDLQKDVSQLTSLPEGPFSTRADAVLVCALVGGGSVWPGSLPPDEAVDKAAAIDTLDWRLKDDVAAPQCGDRPRGRAFTVSYRDLKGDGHTYLNTDLLCDGWVFLDSYYVALSELGTDYWTHQPAQDSYPPCPSVLFEPTRTSTGQARALPKGTVLSAASVCAHPTVDPLAVASNEVPRMLYVRRGAMGDRDLATLNANLARTGATSGTASCKQTWPLDVTYVVRAVTSAGVTVNLRAHAACLPSFHVNNDTTATVTLDQDTVDTITGPLDRFP